MEDGDNNACSKFPVKLFLLKERDCNESEGKDGSVPVNAFPCKSRCVNLVNVSRDDDGRVPVSPDCINVNDWRYGRWKLGMVVSPVVYPAISLLI